MGDDIRITELVGELEDKDIFTRKKAADALIRIGKPAVESLVIALDSEVQEVREVAAMILVQIGPPVSCLPALRNVALDVEGPPGVLLGRAILKIDHKEIPSVSQLPASTKDWLDIMNLFALLRSRKVRDALSLVSDTNAKNPDNPLPLFLEGILAYSIRSDTAALECFRKCMTLVPLYAEVPYYFGQIMVESAIDAYEKTNLGRSTAEMALKSVGTYIDAVAAFAWAEAASKETNLKSIEAHLGTYKTLLGIDHFEGVPFVAGKLPSGTIIFETEYSTPEKWLFTLGLPYESYNFERRELLADLAMSLGGQGTVVFLVGDTPTVGPVSMLLSRRKHSTVFEIGPMTSDDSIRYSISHTSPNTVFIINSRRIGFGKYFSWIPSCPNCSVQAVLVNPDSFLSVEFLGLLSRLHAVQEKRVEVSLSLATVHS
jgi:hypothetical protein